MDFMLSEYDALPFGLLRHGTTQKHALRSEQAAPKFVQCCPPLEQNVKPLDKVSDDYNRLSIVALHRAQECCACLKRVNVGGAACFFIALITSGVFVSGFENHRY